MIVTCILSWGWMASSEVWKWVGSAVPARYRQSGEGQPSKRAALPECRLHRFGHLEPQAVEGRVDLQLARQPTVGQAFGRCAVKHVVLLGLHGR